MKRLCEHIIMKLYPQNFISEFFDISNFNFQMSGAYAPEFQSGFPFYHLESVLSLLHLGETLSFPSFWDTS